MTAGAGAGAALGGGAGIATELFDRATEGSRLRKANKTLAGVSEAVKHRLADPEVAAHAQQYQAAREYPARMTELGALVGGLAGSAYGAHSAPVVEGDPRVSLFGVEGPTKGQLSNASKYGLGGTLAAAGLAGLGGLWWKHHQRKNLVNALAHHKTAAQQATYGEKLKQMFFRKHPPEDYSVLPSGMKVKLVDGVAVRNLLLAEFIGGGHSLVYDFIPSDEIWLDNEVAEEDRSFILAHEVYERELIRRGVEYSTAHDQANEIETKFRSMKRDPKVAANRNQDPNIPEDRWLATNAPQRTPTGGRPAKSSNRYLMAGLTSTLERFSTGRNGAQIAKKAFVNLTRAIVTSTEPNQNEKQASKSPKLRSRSETVVYSQGGVVAIKKEDFLQFPGGGIDPGEEPAFAAYRESIEEADRKLLHLRPIGIQETVWPEGSDIVKGYDGFRNHLYLAMDGGKCGTTHEDNEDFGLIPFKEAIEFLESLKDRKDLQWRRSMIDAELAAIREGEKACEDMTAKKLATELAGSPSQEVAGPRCAIMPHEEPDRADNSPAVLVDLDGTIREWPGGNNCTSYSKLNNHQIMPGRKETLGPLKGMGFKIIGVTNHSMHPDSRHAGMTPEILEQIQHETIGHMDGMLDDIVYTEKPDPDTLKPAPTMIHFAIKRHGVDPTKVMMVGDNHDHDGGAAKAAGIPFMHADDFFRDPEITVEQIKRLMGHAEAPPVEKTADAINLLPRSEYILLNHEGKVLAAPDPGRRYRFPVHGDEEKLPFKTKRAPYQGSLQYVPQSGVTEPGAHGYQYTFHTGALDDANAQAEQAFSGLPGGEWQDPHALLKNLYASMGRKENAQYRDLDRARASVLLRALKAHKKAPAVQPPVHQDPAPQPGMTASPSFAAPPTPMA
jgi:HAD superfamily hydrolase (TIGR01662 family)